MVLPPLRHHEVRPNRWHFLQASTLPTPSQHSSQNRYLLLGTALRKHIIYQASDHSMFSNVQNKASSSYSNGVNGTLEIRTSYV